MQRRAHIGWHLLALVALVVPFTVLPAPPVMGYAHLCGCFYSDSPNIYYRPHYMTAYYIDLMDEARRAWNARAVPGYIHYSPSSTDPNINVFDNNYSWGAWAITVYSCNSCGKWTSDQVDIQFNDRTMNDSRLSYSQRRNVLIHELGHAYGLEHVSHSQCGITVMLTDAAVRCSGSPPWYDDDAGVNARHR